MRPKVLIIEDEQPIAEMYRIVFEDIHHFDFLVASCGEDGIKMIKEHNPDVVLLDIMMPKMDGYEVLKKLHKEKLKDMLIIMISNLNQDSDIKKAEKFGVYEYLIKSDYTPEELVGKVEDIFQQHHAESHEYKSSYTLHL